MLKIFPMIYHFFHLQLSYYPHKKLQCHYNLRWRESDHRCRKINIFSLTRNFIVIAIQDRWRGSNHGGKKINIFAVQRGCAIFLWDSYPSSINYFLTNFIIVYFNVNIFTINDVIGYCFCTTQIVLWHLWPFSNSFKSVNFERG